MNMGIMSHMGSGVGWMGGGVMLLLWAALIASACWLVIRAASPARLVPVRVDRARDLLAERYARGEISTEEYLDRLTYLTSR
ncbi:SHOCT domain-containing protein [Nonomuraea sp. NPDC049377]|uniref:SHOCT domain-containing protein n=2 Tax=unclassified Nonomuraea TaxID=2593643 RepID=UPI0037B53049